MKAFTGIPFLRVLIPFISGILLGLKFEMLNVPFYILLLFLIPVIFFWRYKPGSTVYKRMFMLSADVFLLLYGLILTEQSNLNNQPDYYGNLVNTDSSITFIATINDIPTEKEKFIKCSLMFNEVKQNAGFVKTEGNIFVYFRKSPGAQSIKAGQTLLVTTRLQELSPPKNPLEFNYSNYLYNKQIYHTAFVDSGMYAILVVKNQLNPVWNLGLTCKQFLLTRLKSSALNKNAFAICAALITGYDDEIDKSVMEAFSHSGTLHVLSVSGLHTGLIYLALNFLFHFFDRKNKYKLLQFIFITVFLWFFALVTGFSAPVLRAVIMFNLLGFGKIFYRATYKHQVNILLVSAFILLLYNPYYLVDVGFLLSYFALLGLLYFQPRFSQLWQPKNKSVNYIWQSITASMAATLSTLPITLFYFKQFPLWFFVCNIVVVPATFLILILAVFVVFKLDAIAVLLNHIINGLIWFINLFNSKNTGYIDSIHFDFSDVIFISLFIITISIAIEYRLYRQLAFSCIILITWQVFNLFVSYNTKTKSVFTVYHIKNKSICSVKNKTNVYLSGMHTDSYNYHVKPQMISYNNPELILLNYNVLKAKNLHVVFLNKPVFWPIMDYKEVNTLVLSNNFKLTVQDIKKCENLKTIILDASNNNQTLAKTEELSRNFGITFYATKYKGAYLTEL